MLFTIGDGKFLGDVVSLIHMCLHFVVQCPQKIDKLTAVHPYFPSTVSKAIVKWIKQHTAVCYAFYTSLLTVANRGSIISSYIHSASTTANTTSSLRQDIGSYLFVQCFEEYVIESRSFWPRDEKYLDSSLSPFYFPS